MLPVVCPSTCQGACAKSWTFCRRRRGARTLWVAPSTGGAWGQRGKEMAPQVWMRGRNVLSTHKGMALSYRRMVP